MDAAVRDASTRVAAVMTTMRCNMVAMEGMSVVELSLLALLGFGPQSMSAARQHDGIDPTTMVRSVDRMERLLLVERIPHPTDRRQKLVSATQHGAELLLRLSGKLKP